jgi:Fe-Mn family superoxide dismutase
MSKSSQNRRQFLKNTGKAGIALATAPIISGWNFAITEFQQQALPYAYNALEPFIDAMTMEIHYTKHAATYAKNLADACTAEKVNTDTTSLRKLLANISTYSAKMRNNAGGHFNHEFFWQIMKPSPATVPQNELAEAINKTFGSFTAFQTAFTDAAKARFGSGWAWLIVKADGQLAVCSTANQDNPLMDIAETKGEPIIGLDVWEHAYYLKYQNLRVNYVADFMENINWNFVNQQLVK